MDKLKMQSMDKVQGNIEKIQALFPNAVTEVKRNGKIELKVDFDVLKQELASELIDDRELRYQFTWPDKQKAVLLANTPVNKTLRPCKEESVDFDNTQNLYIEGDNLEVLKLLQETYLGKIKMIYIDPPYNTGNDFVYNDDFAIENQEYMDNSGQYDDEGNRLVLNTESNGRFHTDWLNMIYPRLRLAKDLLSDDGVIFISIGQDEVHNTITMCDEIFSGINHVGTISRTMKSGGNKGQYFSPNIEYILVYAKNISELEVFREPLSEDIIKTYNHIENSGDKVGERYTVKGLCQPGLGNRPNQRFWIEAPDGTFLIPKGVTFPSTIAEGEKILPTDDDTCWKWTYDRYKEEKQKGNILFQKNTSATALVDENKQIAKWNVFNKIWLSDRMDEGRVPVDLITKWENRVSSQELKNLGIPFDFAKPTDLIAYLISLVGHTQNSIILDFFSGSATTAHAVMQLNAEDGGKRKFIIVQLPEPCDEKSEAYKAGYKNICEIGKERIRRAGAKIEQENGLTAQNLDTGFRVLKLDESNMQPVYYNPEDYSQTLLDDLTDNIKPDRTPLDLLFQVMLDLGKPLSAKIEEKDIAGKHVFIVNDDDLIACFDSNVTEETVKTIAQMKPLYAVFRDSGLSSDSVAANFDQIFATYSPNTVRKVL